MKRFGFRQMMVAGVIVIAVVFSGTALATHVFDDVADTAFYAAATSWAKDNNITTGSPAGSKTFKPQDPVTRGESVTFLKRYDDNVVQPALSDLAPIMTRLTYRDENTNTPTGGLAYSKVRDLGSFTTYDDGSLTTLVVNGHASVSGTTDFCHYQIRVDGLTDVGLAPTVWEEESGGNAVLYATSAYTVVVTFKDLAPGAHTIGLYLRGNATTCTHNTGDFSHVIVVTEESVSGASSLSRFASAATTADGGGQ